MPLVLTTGNILVKSLKSNSVKPRPSIWIQLAFNPIPSMKEYTFEYTRKGFASLLFILSFIIIGIEILFFKIFLSNILSPLWFTVISIASAVAFFLLNKYRIKKTGVAKLNADGLTIELGDVTHIAFSNLKYYYIYDGKNGIVFTLGFSDATKFKIEANNNFCDTALLSPFLIDFQSAMQSYNQQNNANIIHLESIYARKQAVYILSALTALVIAGFCFTKMPVMILPIGLSVSVLVGWISYFQQKRKGKLVDF
jgi:hypothetical protein